MQFMSICTEKPDDMADLTEIGLQPEEQPQRTPSKRGSRRSRRNNSNATPSTPSISTSFEDTLVPPTPGTAKDAMFGSSTSPAMPTVTPVTRTSSRGGRSRKGSAMAKPPPIDTLAIPIPITRSASHGSRVAPASPAQLLSPLDRRSKSLKPRKRSESTRQDAPPMPFLPRSSSDMSNITPLSPSLEDVKPLEISANRWIPSSVAGRGHLPRGTALSGVSEPPETVERKIKALLNKLTMEKFDSISDQIVAWANKSEAEADGTTLQLVIQLVFEKATDEATWSHMYARLCRKMMEHVSSDVRENKEGKPVAGGQLFRQYLLFRCQTNFEKGWSAKEDLEVAVVAASGAAPGEIVFSDEYYALQKAKRRGLGLVKFIGELFKLQMLTEKIMHRCILKLLDEPAEEDIESVCQLLITVGSALSGPKGKEPMDRYFEKMKGLAADHAVSSRIRFMLQVSVLRETECIYLPIYYDRK
jgi:translation initiation factor 4G